MKKIIGIGLRSNVDEIEGLVLEAKDILTQYGFFSICVQHDEDKTTNIYANGNYLAHLIHTPHLNDRINYKPGNNHFESNCYACFVELRTEMDYLEKGMQELERDLCGISSQKPS